MRYTTSMTGAAVLLAFAPSTIATGVATLVNGCGFPIYYASISGSAAGMTYLAPGAAYSEGYAAPGVGVSIKVAPSDSLTAGITQFEFTWADGKINYDISNINGNPFAANGMVLSPSMAGDPNNPTCVPVDCPSSAGGTCAAAYNLPDDTATKVCSEDSSLTMTICSGGAKLKRSPEANPVAIPEAVPEAFPEASPKAHPDVAITHVHHRSHPRFFPKK